MPNSNLEKIIKLTQAQYDTLSSGGTVGDYTGLNDNYLYLIQDDTEYSTASNLENGEGDYSLQQKADTETAHVKGGLALGDNSAAFGLGDTYEITLSLAAGGHAAIPSSITVNPNWQNMILECQGNYYRITSVSELGIDVDPSFPDVLENVTANVITQVAKGNSSFVAGEYSQAFGEASHADGIASKAVGIGSFAGGYYSVANQAYSFAYGDHATAAGVGQVAVGKFNAVNFEDPFVVGNGQGGALHNAFTVRADGRATVAKNPTASMDVATKDYVDAKVITVALAQVVSYGNDSYTGTPYIRFQPTSAQTSILTNENVQVIKLDLTALGNNAPAPYIWIKRNTKVELPNPSDPSTTIPAYQFSCGGEQFWYNNYATDIAIKDLGNGALVYVPALGTCDITLASISIPALLYDLGQISLKYEKPSGGIPASDLAQTYVVKQNSRKVVYATSQTASSGVYPDTTIAYSAGLNASCIIQRDADKQIMVPDTPTQNNHAASKLYVDTKSSATNILNGTGTNAVQEKMADATVNFAGRNAHAEALDSSLSTTLNTGASGSQSAAFGKNTMALSTASFTTGNKTIAKGEESHAEGYQSVTLGDGSHAEGAQTVAYGIQSHSEGALTQAIADESHAEGHNTTAGSLVSGIKQGIASHTEGVDTKIGSYSPTSDQGADQSGGGGGGGGGGTPPSPGAFTAGEGSHAEGYSNLVVGFGSHAEGLRNYLTGNYAHVEGVNNTNSGNYAHVEGYNNINSGDVSLVAGVWNNNSGPNSILLGRYLTNTQADKVIVGQYNVDSSAIIFAVGTGSSSTPANGFAVFGDGHAEVENSSGGSKHVVNTSYLTSYVSSAISSKENASNKVTSITSASTDVQYPSAKATYDLVLAHSITNLNLANGAGTSSIQETLGTAAGAYSHAEGNSTVTDTGTLAHAEGRTTTASGVAAHAEGTSTTASGSESPHAEGAGTTASGNYSHAEGAYTVASGECAHAGGAFTTAGYAYQTVIGVFNDNKSDTMFEVGKGADANNRANVFEVHSDGRATVGLNPTNNMDVVTKQYADGLMTPTAVGQGQTAANISGYNGIEFTVGTTNYNGLYIFTYGNCMIMLPLYSPTSGTEYKTAATLVDSGGSYMVKTLTYKYISSSGKLQIYQKENYIPTGYGAALFKIKLF